MKIIPSKEKKKCISSKQEAVALFVFPVAQLHHTFFIMQKHDTDSRPTVLMKRAGRRTQWRTAAQRHVQTL